MVTQFAAGIIGKIAGIIGKIAGIIGKSRDHRQEPGSLVR